MRRIGIPPLIFQRIGPTLRWALGGPSMSWLLFQVLAFVAVSAWTLLNLMPAMRRYGMEPFFEVVVVPSLTSGTVLLLGLRTLVLGQPGMTQRPWRFAGVLMAVALAAALAVRLVAMMMGNLIWGALSNPQLWLNIAFDTQATFLMNAPFTWLSLMYIEHTALRRRFAALRGQHALMTRQLSQSRLRAASARIDPAGVTRVLHAVRARYATAPQDAVQLLNRLTEHLRAVMHRPDRAQHNDAGELIRSLAALLAAEAQQPIDVRCDASAGGVGGAPLQAASFALVKLVLFQAFQARLSAIVLNVVMSEKTHTVRLRFSPCHGVPVFIDGVSHALAIGPWPEGVWVDACETSEGCEYVVQAHAI